MNIWQQNAFLEFIEQRMILSMHNLWGDSYNVNDLTELR